MLFGKHLLSKGIRSAFGQQRERFWMSVKLFALGIAPST
jgi:hypothetical protein